MGLLNATRIAGSTTRADPVPTPEISRFDVLCGPGVVQTVLELTRRWAEDRRVSEVAKVRLEALVRVAIEHGLRFDPQGVTLLIGWLHPDRARLVVRWHGGSGTARGMEPDGSVGVTISTLDTFSQHWGFARSGDDAVHWVVFGTV